MCVDSNICISSKISSIIQDIDMQCLEEDHIPVFLHVKTEDAQTSAWLERKKDICDRSKIAEKIHHLRLALSCADVDLINSHSNVLTWLSNVAWNLVACLRRWCLQRGDRCLNRIFLIIRAPLINSRETWVAYLRSYERAGLIVPLRVVHLVRYLNKCVAIFFIHDGKFVLR